MDVYVITVVLVALLCFVLGAAWQRARHIRNCDCLEQPFTFDLDRSDVVPPHTKDTVDPPFLYSVTDDVDSPISFVLNEHTEKVELHVSHIRTKQDATDALDAWAGLGIVRGTE